MKRIDYNKQGSIQIKDENLFNQNLGQIGTKGKLC